MHAYKSKERGEFIQKNQNTNRGMKETCTALRLTPYTPPRARSTAKPDNRDPRIQGNSIQSRKNLEKKTVYAGYGKRKRIRGPGGRQKGLNLRRTALDVMYGTVGLRIYPPI